MFQSFILKQLLKKQIKHLPQSEQDRILSIIEKNPDFFVKIAEEAQTKMNSGMSQQDALMFVMKGRQEELKRIMNG